MQNQHSLSGLFAHTCSFMCSPLAFVFSPVFSLMLALKMSPLEMCSSPKVLTMRPDTVPFPDPGGPMMTARISLCTTISTRVLLFLRFTKQEQLRVLTQLFFLSTFGQKLVRMLFGPSRRYATMGESLQPLEEEEGKEEEKDEKPSVQQAKMQIHMIVLKEPFQTCYETYSSLIALLGMHVLYNTVM